MPSDTTSSEPIRVLLVDDNAMMLARARAALARHCDVVAAVNCGARAISEARKLSPDVIVLDISMEGMTGIEVADCLRKSGSTAAVVFLTVHDEYDVVEAAKAAGGIGYVIKSRLTTDLSIAVREASVGRSFTSPVS
jgi:DNA-binding NarL/FixJ family response regulator